MNMNLTSERTVVMKHGRLRDIAGVSDIGPRRRNNEDAIAWDAELGLALVADGVGGNNGGEVASSTIVRSIKSDLKTALAGDGKRASARSGEYQSAMVHELVRRANQRILAMAARDPKLYGMGATLVVALLVDDGIVVANVGDSRVYRMRDGVLERLTRDHLLVSDMVERGCLSEEQARSSRSRNVLSRALGMSGKLEVDVTRHPLQSGDLYLLCSDGLTGAVSDDELAAHLGNFDVGLRELAQGAVALANRRGGRDNVSAVLMRIT